MMRDICKGKDCKIHNMMMDICMGRHCMMNSMSMDRDCKVSNLKRDSSMGIRDKVSMDTLLDCISLDCGGCDALDYI